LGNNGVNFVNDTDCVHCIALCEIEIFDLCEVRSRLDPCKDLHKIRDNLEHNKRYLRTVHTDLFAGLLHH
jgi:hypothetical protein